MNRQRVLVVAAVVVALVVGTVAGAVLFGGDGDDASEAASGDTPDAADDSGEDTEADAGDPGRDGESGSEDGNEESDPVEAGPPPELDTSGLEGDALELAEVINRANQLTYRARYQTPDGATEVEIWRRWPRARRDTRVGSGEESIVTTEFRTAEGGHIGCLGEGSGALCTSAPDGQGAVDPADPVIGQGDPRAGAVTARAEQLGDLAVRCFVVAGAGTQGADVELCFDADGIPAVIDGGDGRLERSELSRGVETDDLEPPNASVGNTTTTAGPIAP